jgi:hypothetical protein
MGKNNTSRKNQSKRKRRNLTIKKLFKLTKVYTSKEVEESRRTAYNYLAK